MKEEKTLLKGALILSIGSVFVKLIGAFYRVPLTNLIGPSAIGIYQMVFPFYSILLTFSSTGVPNALSKLIAEGKNPKKVLYKSIKCFSLIGLLGSLLMLLLCKPISFLQGNSDAFLSFIALSPSVFLVSIISCYRGYFQGLSNMLPTTLSQIIEQGVKLIVALTVLSFIKGSAMLLASICCLAVTVSELTSLCYIYIRYKRQKNLQDSGKNIALKEIIKTVFPIALSAVLIPLSRTLDSFLIINLLPLETEIATAQYGIYSGGVESLIGVPVAVCYGLAVSGIPQIAKNKSNQKLKSKLILYTLLLSAFSMLAVFLFSKTAVNVLYPKLNEKESALMINLLKISSIQIVLLSILQTLNSILVSVGAQFVPPISLSVGVAVKILTVILLVPKLNFGIYGLAISDITCFFVATICNLLYIIKVRNFISYKKIVQKV